MDKRIDLIIANLRDVYDPEIPVNIYDLGLIYSVDVDGKDTAHIIMTLTAPGCPVADVLLEEAKQSALLVEGVNDAEVELVFDPPWDKSMMSEEARLELGFY